MAFRLPSPLPESTEVIVTAAIDSAVEVHRQLGPGRRCFLILERQAYGLVC